MSPAGHPSLRIERRMMRSGPRNVVGIDEVGRGSLAGPVTVGAVMVGPETPTAPAGLRDSKELAPHKRDALVPRIRRWARTFAIGHAQPEEIDRLGLTAALRLAAARALADLTEEPCAILLDGQHDWLSSHPDGLPVAAAGARVSTLVKADRDCSSVAAASVLAKVARDALIVGLAGDTDPYRWRANKGYAAPEHLAALAQLGPTLLHRLSWELPGVPAAAFDAIDPDRIRTARRFSRPEQLVLLDAPAREHVGQSAI